METVAVAWIYPFALLAQLMRFLKSDRLLPQICVDRFLKTYIVMRITVVYPFIEMDS